MWVPICYQNCYQPTEPVHSLVSYNHRPTPRSSLWAEGLMARKFEMTWIASRLRWMKMYKGIRYVISCKALGVAENKDGSYLAANEWWMNKRAEIDDVNITQTDPIVAVLEDWRGSPLNDQLDLISTFRAFVEAHRD